MNTTPAATPNKEQVYDEQIAPLMDSIIKLAQEHGIAMLATFAIPTEANPDLVCTTYMPDGAGKANPALYEALKCVRGSSPAIAPVLSSGASS
jgi:hypothetical protein